MELISVILPYLMYFAAAVVVSVVALYTNMLITMWQKNSPITSYNLKFGNILRKANMDGAVFLIGTMFLLLGAVCALWLAYMLLLKVPFLLIYKTGSKYNFSLDRLAKFLNSTLTTHKGY